MDVDLEFPRQNRRRKVTCSEDKDNFIVLLSFFSNGYCCKGCFLYFLKGGYSKLAFWRVGLGSIQNGRYSKQASLE